MKSYTSPTGLRVTIDPLKAFEGIKDAKLLEATGLLAYFAADVAMTGPESVPEAFAAIMECYWFGMGQDGTGWGTVDDMLYKSEHEGDSDLPPLVAFHLTDEIDFLVYQHAICAVTDGTETMMARMD